MRIQPKKTEEMDCEVAVGQGWEFWANKNSIVQNAMAAKNSGWAMISRSGASWYYSWADGSQNGNEGPFKTEEEARIAAKQDGFRIKNSAVSKNDLPDGYDTSRAFYQGIAKITKELKNLHARYEHMATVAEWKNAPQRFKTLVNSIIDERCIEPLIQVCEQLSRVR